MRCRALLLAWLMLCAASAWAQPTMVDLETISPAPTGEWDFEGGKFHFPEVVFASLPAAGTSGRIYIVTDSSSCTADVGTARVICRDTGAAWEAIGSGGGGGTECSTSPCDLDAATTQDGKGICLADGTNCPGIATPTPTPTNTTATSTPTPTPTVTATNQVFACPTVGDKGGVYGITDRYGQLIQAVGCKPTPTPTVTSTAATATPTATPTVTPLACPTDASGHLGGLYAARPELCKALPATATPWPTLTPFATVTPTPILCPTANGPFGYVGGLLGAHPESCLSLVTPTPTVTATVTPTATVTATPTVTITVTPIACPTDALGRGGLIDAHPEKCGAPVATVTPTPTATVTATPQACGAYSYDAVVGPDVGSTCVAAVTPNVYATPTPYQTWTPGPTPTAYPFTGQEGDVTVSNAVTTLDFDGAYFDLTESPTGELNITISSSVMTVGSTVQPSQLNRLAADDQKRYFGTTDQVFVQLNSTANALQMAGRLMITGPTATAPAATATATVVVTPTPTNIPTATSATATPTPTATSNTPTPTVSPTPGRIENVGVMLNGKLWSPDDGSTGFEIVTSVAASGGLGFNTTTQYTGVGASGFQSTTTETVAPSYAAAAMKCDRLRACFITSNLAINERMRVALRTGRTINNMADTLLTCTADGNSSQTDGCSGDGSNSGKRGCTVTLPYPVTIRAGFARTLSFQCNGAQCGIASTGAIVSLWCWPDNR